LLFRIDLNRPAQEQVF